TPSGTSVVNTADQFTYAGAAPTVSSISPNTDSTAGGMLITLLGTNLTGATAVNFGSTRAYQFQVSSDSSITVTDPLHSAGTLDITVINAFGTSILSAADQFTYTVNGLTPTITAISPTSGSTAGGTSVTLTGAHLTGALGVAFGTIQAASFTVNSDTSITATAPS